MVGVVAPTPTWDSATWAIVRAPALGAGSRVGGRDVLCISSRDGQPFSVIGFTVTDGQISEIDILMDPDRLRQLDLSALDDQRP
jgi:hypothetical protein